MGHEFTGRWNRGRRRGPGAGGGRPRDRGADRALRRVRPLRRGSLQPLRRRPGRRASPTASRARSPAAADPRSIPGKNVFKLDDDVSDEAGATVEPLAVGVHAGEARRLGRGRDGASCSGWGRSASRSSRSCVPGVQSASWAWTCRSCASTLRRKLGADAIDGLRPRAGAVGRARRRRGGRLRLRVLRRPRAGDRGARRRSAQGGRSSCWRSTTTRSPSTPDGARAEGVRLQGSIGVYE